MGNINDFLKEAKKKEFNKKIEKAKINKIQKNVIEEIEVYKLKENPYQPRYFIDNTKIEELAESIKNQGLIQPIIVSLIDNEYYIVAGHRRVQAHKLLGKEKIKAIVLPQEKTENMATKAIIENFQREDLNVIEMAIALEKYKKDFNKSVTEIATEIGMDRASVSKIINLINLPEKIKNDIRTEKNKKKDFVALSKINSLSNKLKEEFEKEKIEEIQLKAYEIYKKEGRAELENFISSIFKKENKQKKSYEVKINKNKIEIKIDKKFEGKKDRIAQEIAKILEIFLQGEE